MTATPAPATSRPVPAPHHPAPPPGPFLVTPRAGMRTGTFLTLVVATILLGIFLFPMLLMVTTSLKNSQEIKNPLQLFPGVPRFDNYPQALKSMDFVNALANTVVVTFTTVIGQVLSCSLVGFGFAKFRFPGRSFVFYLMLATMMLPAQVTMIPVFVLFRSLGLVDSLLALIIPAWFGAPFFIYMFRQFFSSIPDEIIEAARVDGASVPGIFVRILLPMSWPVIAVVAVFTFIGAWNDYLGPLLYLNSPRQYTLSIALANLTGQYGASDTNLLMAASVVTMLPCILLFFAAQRYLVDSDVAASIKG